MSASEIAVSTRTRPEIGSAVRVEAVHPALVFSSGCSGKEKGDVLNIFELCRLVDRNADGPVVEVAKVDL